jgi:uncharacterized protein (TIRG00374 family)
MSDTHLPSFMTEAVASASERGGRDGMIGRTTLRLAGVLIAALALWGTFRGVDARAITALIAHSGVRVVVVMVPSLLAVTLECTSWRMAFQTMGRRVRLGALFCSRVASESVGSLLPLGAVWSETVKPALLTRYAGLPVSTGIAGIAARKYLLMSAHAAYLALGFALGHAALATCFDEMLGAPWLSTIALAAGVGVFASAQAMACALRGGRLFERALLALRAIPVHQVRTALARLNAGARLTDDDVRRFFRASYGKLVVAVAFCLAGWLLEAVEAWIILRVLGAPLDFGVVIGVEVTINLARQLLVFLPGGLGAQELGNAAFFGALGVELETAAAFALLKRGKELVWIVLGLGLLAPWPRHVRATVPMT